MEVREASAKYLPQEDEGCPVGYKKTEVGVIPEDWVLTPFIHAVESYIDYRGRTPRKLGMAWGGGNILALSANNVQMGRINPDKEAYFASEELYRRWMVQGDCEPGDVLLTMEAPLGNVAQIPDDRKYILSQRVILVRPKAWLSRDLLAHSMRGEYFQRQLSINATGSTAQGIQRKKLDLIWVYFPADKSEQQAIASALSDADALIESLSQLLAKKRQIKQGAMQELLTGKRRLPGFSGEWESGALGQICDRIVGGGTPSRQVPSYWGGDIPWMTVKDFASFSPRETLEYITRDGLQNSSSSLIPRGTLITSSRMALGKSVIYEVDVAINQDLKALFLKNDINVIFLNYWFQLNEKFIAEMGSGSTVMGISLHDLRRMRFAWPSYDEQTRIASVLSDMDAEIATLEAKLAKARQLKQGMMQALLTGRIRLV